MVLKSEEGWSRVVEGRTTLLVPTESLARAVPPKGPAFYNPAAKMNRDFSVAMSSALASGFPKACRFADALAGVGARGLRVATEVPEVDEVFLNDLNPIAIDAARRAAELNSIVARCKFSTKETCAFLQDRATPADRYELNDIDPFGSPAPFLDCAVRAVRDQGVVSLTATDTAVLCGLYPKTAFRRYHGYPLRSEYCHEVGVRLLLGAVAFCGMRMELGTAPLFSHSTRHYFRVYVRIVAGASKADETVDRLGFIMHCFGCGSRKVSRSAEHVCDSCKGKFNVGGPLWIGRLHDGETLAQLRNVCARMSMGGCARLVARAEEELDAPPTYFVPDRVADAFDVPSPSPTELIGALRSLGYRASRASLNPRAVRTDAPAATVYRLIRERSAFSRKASPITL